MKHVAVFSLLLLRIFSTLRGVLSGKAYGKSYFKIFITGIFSFFLGPKTIFFWAPIMKWGLVCAGLADMARPAEKLSTAQSAVLMATGFIWSRYSLVIIPKNWSLFAVNFFVGTAGASQLFRIWRYNQGLKAKANK
ncbi:mitochondrial pyruvate carrier 2 isoform X1 [Pseudorca crassidens]|uniref:mitochondrial pyruvate carrier 2 isoform X1 n=1 Tax=Pseudorca crassidens TaxID=82174 RepID=UPI00352DA5F9